MREGRREAKAEIRKVNKEMMRTLFRRNPERCFFVWSALILFWIIDIISWRIRVNTLKKGVYRWVYM